MANITNNRKFSEMLSQHKIQHPDAGQLAQAEKTLDQGSIAYQLDRQGARKLYAALDEQARNAKSGVK